jgi:chaperonin cofactor prefoldin
LTKEETKENIKDGKEEGNQTLKKVFDAWADSLLWIQNRTPGIPVIGPGAGLATKSVSINAELAQAMEALAEFNKNLMQYYAKIGSTWIEATKKVLAESPAEISTEEARERLKNVWIEKFEQDFTLLFDSEDFAEIFGKMLKNEIKFNKHVRNLVELLSTNIGVPTRSEMDSVYKEIERIKNKLKEMNDAIKELSKSAKQTARVK